MLSPSFVLLAYFSPETMLPLSSILATIAGCALMIKRSSLRFAARSCRAVIHRRRVGRPANAPHFQMAEKELDRTTNS
jgi:hypothetical protein